MASPSKRPALARPMSPSASSVSSSLPSSPGPSVSVRAPRSSTPALSAPSVSSPTFSSFSRDGTLHHGRSYLASRQRDGVEGASPRMFNRDRSASTLSVATSTVSRRAATKQRPGMPTLKSGYTSYMSSSAGPLSPTLSTADAASAAIPPILINGGVRPEDVDISSIGRLPGTDINATVSSDAAEAGIDGLFMRFNVKEVRTIAVRGRDKAEAKRAELRTMVGERYRDLLSAADSIIRMRKSSTVLIDKLEYARSECDPLSMADRVAQEDMARSRAISRAATPLPNGQTPYAVAMLVKLFLDCPEHIWRAVERQEFVTAAKLEAMGRALYLELTGRQIDAGSEEASSGLEDDNGVLQTFPLLLQQAEGYKLLRSQLSQKARDHMRRWDSDLQTTAEAVAAVVLLDQISLSQAMDILLEQRMHSLRGVLSSYSSTEAGAAPAPASSLDVASTLHQYHNILRSTQQQAAKLFEHDHGVVSSIPQPATATDSPKASRRLSRLYAAAAPASPFELSTNHSLSLLPNAHLLQRYLPPETLQRVAHQQSSPGTIKDVHGLDRAVGQWAEAAVDYLQQELGRLLSSIVTARELAAIRRTLTAETGDYEATGNIHDGWRRAYQTTVHDALQLRFVEVYKQELDQQAAAVPALLNHALSQVSESAEDLDVVKFLFSPNTPFPTTSSLYSYNNALSENTKADPFTTFQSAMQDRVIGRSPLLCECIRALEKQAAGVRADVSQWLSVHRDKSTDKAYLESASLAFGAISQSMTVNLSQMEDADQALFIGNVALQLARHGTFLDDLFLGHGEPKKQSVDVLLQIEASSRHLWLQKAVQQTVSDAVGLIKADLQVIRHCQKGSSPSTWTYAATYGLIRQLRKIGPHRLTAVPGIITKLLQAFAHGLSEGAIALGLVENGKSQQGREQAAYSKQFQQDIDFLRQIFAAAGVNDAFSAMPSTQQGDGASMAEQLARLTLLFYPLLSKAEMPQQVLRKSTGPAEMDLGVLKPGPRLALLPVNATAA